MKKTLFELTIFDSYSPCPKTSRNLSKEQTLFIGYFKTEKQVKAFLESLICAYCETLKEFSLAAIHPFHFGNGTDPESITFTHKLLYQNTNMPCLDYSFFVWKKKVSQEEIDNILSIYYSPEKVLDTLSLHSKTYYRGINIMPLPIFQKPIKEQK